MLLSGEDLLLHLMLSDGPGGDQFAALFMFMVITVTLVAAIVVVGHVVHDWWRKRRGRGTTTT